MGGYALWIAVCAGLAAVGVLMVAVGGYGAPPRSPFTRRWRLLPQRWGTRLTRAGLLRAGGAAAAGVLVWLVSGWPVAGILTAAAVAGLPYFFGAGRVAKRRIARLEALEEWTRRLADTMAIGMAPVQALVRSAEHPPSPIRAEVTALANGLSTPRIPREQVLRRFADDLDDALGDMIALALGIAVSAQVSERVPDVLRTMAVGVAEEVKARRSVEADRAGPRNEARLIVIVQVLFVVAVAAFTDYTRIYGTAAGQLVLAGLGAVTVLALWLLRRYSSTAPPPRLLTRDGVGR